MDTHGIELEFKKQGRTFRSTYLPGVAEEQGWDVETALNHLVRKGGYEGDFHTIEKDEW